MAAEPPRQPTARLEWWANAQTCLLDFAAEVEATYAGDVNRLRLRAR